MKQKKVLMAASVASMIDQFNMPNIRLMQEMGYEVHVACNFKDGNTCDAGRIRRLRRMLGDMGVVMHQWDCPRNIDSFQKCWNAYMQIWQLTGRYPYAWIHCHSPVGGALARIAAHYRGIRIIYTAHGFHFYKGAPVKNWLLYYPAEKFLARWTQILVTVNREDECFARRWLHAGDIFRIPGVGIDTKRFADSSRRKREEFLRTFDLPEHVRVILSVGELNEGKNHRIAVAALALMQRQDVYYLICGQGQLKEMLQKYADSLGAGGRIRMAGFQEDMPWIYQNADIFVLPSVREGMPAALMEAMAAGMPCVVSDIRGNRELIHDAEEDSIRTEAMPLFCKPGGMRFSLNQPAHLTKALKMLLDDASLRQECGMHNKIKIREYDLAAVQKRMRKIYADITA